MHKFYDLIPILTFLLFPLICSNIFADKLDSCINKSSIKQALSMVQDLDKGSQTSTCPLHKNLVSKNNEVNLQIQNYWVPKLKKVTKNEELLNIMLYCSESLIKEDCNVDDECKNNQHRKNLCQISCGNNPIQCKIFSGVNQLAQNFLNCLRIDSRSLQIKVKNLACKNYKAANCKDQNSIELCKQVKKKYSSKFKQVQKIYKSFIVENLLRKDVEFDEFKMNFAKGVGYGDNHNFLPNEGYPSMNDKKQSEHIKKHNTNLGKVTLKTGGDPIVLRSGRSDNKDRMLELIKFKNKNYHNGSKRPLVINSYMDFSALKSSVSSGQDDERKRLKGALQAIQEIGGRDKFSSKAPLFIETMFSNRADGIKGTKNFNYSTGYTDSQKVNTLAHTRLIMEMVKKPDFDLSDKEIKKKLAELKNLLPQPNKLLDMKGSTLSKIKQKQAELLAKMEKSTNDDMTKKTIRAFERLTSGRKVDPNHQGKTIHLDPDERFMDLNFIKKQLNFPLAVQCKSGLDRTSAGAILATVLEKISMDDNLADDCQSSEDLIKDDCAKAVKKYYKKYAGPIGLSTTTYSRGEPGLKWGPHPIPNKLIFDDCGKDKCCKRQYLMAK